MNYIRMATRILGHYELLDKLGEGGMGVVYKARDKHLDRLVAIKLLPADKVANDARKRRFVQEAKAASALNHPNIVTIYDIAQDGGAKPSARGAMFRRFLPSRDSICTLPMS